MDNQPSFDRSLLIPVGVAAFSLIGICGILVAGRIAAARANVQEVATATAFKYAFVGTEPLTVVATVIVSPPPTAEVILLPTRTPAVTISPVTSPSIKTPTRTPISQSSAPLGEGTFDDIHDHLAYSGNWASQTNVPGAHDNTLHVSGTVGDSISFQFIGQELHVFFQAGPSLGTIRLHFNGSDYDMNENNSSTQTYEWVLPSVTNGTHEVTITHLSGGSVNLDYIIIPEVPVTPTKTPTPTSTPR